jgi:hypothetical protein
MKKYNEKKRSSIWHAETHSGSAVEFSPALSFSQLPPLALSKSGAVETFAFPLSLGQHRTKTAWRLCTPSACIFSVISHKNPLTGDSLPARFLHNLTKNLTAHLTHNLCAVLP